MRKTRARPPSDAESDPCVAVGPEIPARSEDAVDESLIETFPCSDPPSWAGVGRVGSPRRCGADDCAAPAGATPAAATPDDEDSS